MRYGIRHAKLVASYVLGMLSRMSSQEDAMSPDQCPDQAACPGDVAREMMNGRFRRMDVKALENINTNTNESIPDYSR